MPENYEAWLTKDEVLQRTGISERTLERRIKEGDIRKAYRNVPGRKPIPILHPDDIATLEAKTLKPIPLKTAPRKLLKDAVNSAASVGTMTTTPARAVTALMAGLTQDNIPLDRKFYLSLEEATRLSGLPKAFLLRAIKEKKLPAVLAGGYRVRRIHLEHFDAVTGKMTK